MKRTRPVSADDLVHEFIRDRMIANGLSRHDLARSFVRGAHDLERLSLPAEKEAAAMFMRDHAARLVSGGGWLLCNAAPAAIRRIP